MDINIETATLEELVKKRQNMVEAVEQIDAGRKALDLEIIDRMTKENLKATQAGNYTITKVTRIKYKVDLETARDYGAVISKESVDTRRIAKLAKSGVKFESETYTYPLIKAIEVD